MDLEHFSPLIHEIEPLEKEDRFEVKELLKAEQERSKNLLKMISEKIESLGGFSLVEKLLEKLPSQDIALISKVAEKYALLKNTTSVTAAKLYPFMQSITDLIEEII